MGQLEDDFSSGSIEANWLGRVDKFLINDQGQLQLNDNTSGSSTIFRSYNLPDSFIIEIEAILDFAPSGSNFGEIFLAYDNDQFENGNGLSIRLGSNGSDDAVTLIEHENGIEKVITEGTIGAIANDPAQVSLRIVRREGLYSLQCRYGSLNNYIDEGSFILPTTYVGMTNFGIKCVYTSSRAKSFYFDNLRITAYEADTEPPTIVSVQVISDNEVLCIWNEPLIASSIVKQNFNINGVNVEDAYFDLNEPNEVRLRLGQRLNGKDLFTITALNISDSEGNIAMESRFDFRYAVAPKEGVLLISEILFNPIGSGSDYVEIYNNSDEQVNIAGLKIRNSQNEQEVTLIKGELGPKSYLAISEDTLNLIETYKPQGAYKLIQFDLPSMNNDEGNVSIYMDGGIWVESFDYSEDYHNELLDDVDGVSLERRSFEVSVTEINNWASAGSSNNYGTPGYTNSNSVGTIGKETIFIDKKNFSPNSDGENDELIITYNLEESGYLISADIFDSNGFKIKSLANNELAGQKGVLKWDGTTNDGQRARIGNYLVFIEAFNTNGSVVTKKEAVNLLDYIGR